MAKFKLVNLDDANVEEPLESLTYPDALEEALELLGWMLVEDGEEDDE